MAGSLACLSLNRDLDSQGQRVIKSKFLVLILLTSGANQGQKLIKSILLGMILSTSGAKVTKSLNQDFWD